MSHFTVLVIGENPEKQLQPYHEFECTGEDDEFVQSINEIQEHREEFANHASEGQSFEAYLESEGVSVVTGDAAPDLTGKHKYGYARVVGGEVVEVIRRTNPNKKWDWYVLGGRWSGMLKLKQGALGVAGRPGAFSERARPGYADQCAIRDIDIAGMREEARAKAEESFGKLQSVLERFPELRSWSEVRGDRKGEGLEQAREEYRAQTGSKELNDAFHMIDCPIDYFGRDREAFVLRSVDSCLVTFAVLKDGVWYERGRMGWWASVSDEKSASDWNTEFSKLLDGLPPETLVSVYDCHI